jgi:hypothetical protein
MKTVNDIRELLAEIKHQQNEAYNNISDGIVCMETKNELMDSDYDEFIQEGHIFDVDGDEVYFIDDSIFAEAATTSLGNKSQYDFKGKDPSVGADNYDIANIIKDIFFASKNIHSTKTTYENRLIANNSKYQKTVDLLDKMNTKSKQNFCKIYYAIPSVSDASVDTHRDTYTFFVELTLPDGTYYYSWHLQRDKNKTVKRPIMEKETRKKKDNDKKTKQEKTVKNKLCDKIDDIVPNGNTVIKYGNKRVAAYEAMEAKYAKEYDQQRNGGKVIAKLVTAFNLKK